MISCFFFVKYKISLIGAKKNFFSLVDFADVAGFGRVTLPVCSVPGRSDLVEDLLLGDLHRVEVLLLDLVLGDYGCAM